MNELEEKKIKDQEFDEKIAIFELVCKVADILVTPEAIKIVYRLCELVNEKGGKLSIEEIEEVSWMLKGKHCVIM